MSGSVNLSMLPLSESERVDVRRFMGYPAYGKGDSGFQNWRFFQAYGTLEYRLTNMANAELQQVRLYLSQLYPLETAILGASDNLDTAQAAVWTRNANEVSDRMRLFDHWRRRLCGFLGLPPGPALGDGGGRRAVVI